MDEGVINGAAIEAISNLELDCEIKEFSKGTGKGDWCIQFSGKYGRFCDDFKNQFDKENSPELIREKIKSHLIKQVNKIRSSTGRRRRSSVGDASERRGTEGDILTGPLKVVGDVLDRATDVAGAVISQASAATDAVRDALSGVADSISPAATEARGTARASREKASGPPRGRTVIAPKAKSAKAKKATKRVARGAAKKVKKVSATARTKAAGTTKAVKKTSRKSSSRRSG